jgi:hypothetical protein
VWQREREKERERERETKIDKWKTTSRKVGRNRKL